MHSKTIMSRLFAVMASCALSSAAWPIAALSDEDMGKVAGGDGLTLDIVKATAATATQASWQDDTRQLQLRDINLSNLDATIRFDVGSSANIPVVALNLVVAPFLFQAGSACLAASGSAAACASSLGELAFRTTADTTLDFYNSRGFFDGTVLGSTAGGRLGIDISNAELYLAHNLNSQRNLIVLKNLYLKGALTGSFSIDATTGVRLFGTLDLPRAGAISGFNLDVAVNPAIASGFTAAGSSTLLHYGMSGSFENFDLRAGGGGSNEVVTGAAVNDAGVKISLSTQLKNSDFEFEFGEGDAEGHAVRFKNFVSFIDGNAASPGVGTVSLGQLYLNVLPATTGELMALRPGFGALTAMADSLGVAIRDLEMMAYPRNIYVYKYSDATETLANPSGSLMLPLYDLDANLLLTPGGHPALGAALRRGIGLDLTAAFTGTNAPATAGATGDKITGLLLADTAPGTGKYIGLRNLNGAIRLQQGQLSAMDAVTDGSTGLRLTAGALQINLDGQVALDDLPDGTAARRIKTTGHLFGLGLQIQSADSMLSLVPSPSGQGYLAFKGSLNLLAGDSSGIGKCAGSASGSGTCLTITEPLDGSQLQLASISGKLNLLDTRIDIGKELTASSGLGTSGMGTTFERAYMRLENTVQFDPGTGADDVFRIANINFLGGGSAASPVATTAYRFGEAVVTGGELYSKIELRQR
ncbi:MAG: hypothetical protein ACOY41_12865 [Pseudomonadota bacterium]